MSCDGYCACGEPYNYDEELEAYMYGCDCTLKRMDLEQGCL